mgnify:CR=1 FL=1
MVKARYINILNNAISLSKRDKALLSEHLVEYELDEGEYFSQPEVAQLKLGYILTGVARMYIHGGKKGDVVICFMEDNQYMGDFESFFSGQPPHSYVQAVTKVKGVYLPIASLAYLQMVIPRLFPYMGNTFNQHLSKKTKLLSQIMNVSSEAAYKAFMKGMPKACMYSSEQDIASFLGTSEKSLASIKENFKCL